MSTSLAPRPVASLVLPETSGLPAYVTREQARAMINAAETTTHRLLLETLWQTGGRVSEVLRLRPCDVNRAEGAIALANLKQKDARKRRKLVYVSEDLVGALLALAKDARVPWMGFYFRSAKSAGRPMSRQNCWALITRYAELAGVFLPNKAGQLRPASGLAFRHGAAVHQIRSAVPLSEVSQQLGHARIDSTTIYTQLANPERRVVADRVEW